MASPVNPKRVHTLKERPRRGGTVVYWMNREQRMNDNWALLFAQSLAVKYASPLSVVFCLVPEFLEATERQYRFMLTGLESLERSLAAKNIPFHLLLGAPDHALPRFAAQHDVESLVTDFNPLRLPMRWKERVTDAVNASVYEVDAHNIVPARIVSPKQEFGAYTIRPKVHRLLPEFLDEFPAVRKHPHAWPFPVAPADWKAADRSLRIDRSVGAVAWCSPGEAEARAVLERFLNSGLPSYDARRNDPTLDGQSGLSPYFHFGHLAPQRAALETVKREGRPVHLIVQRDKNGSAENRGNAEAFLEEMIVRRELSDNFTFYNTAYDSFDGFPAWAQLTLNEHRKDLREHVYSADDFEAAETHDPLWNAAQRQMMRTGKMHGYMRMYWAKKMLEWSASPEEALAGAIRLNDRYELDGRDPNGYAGIAWSIGGVHDRAWFERPVYGKIRYMNDNGCAKKFDVKRYIAEQSGG